MLESAGKMAADIENNVSKLTSQLASRKTAVFLLKPAIFMKFLAVEGLKNVETVGNFPGSMVAETQRRISCAMKAVMPTFLNVSTNGEVYISSGGGYVATRLQWVRIRS